MRIACTALVLLAMLGTPARGDQLMPVDPEQMVAVAAEGDPCSVLDKLDECRVLSSERIFRLGRASIVERLGDAVTALDLVVDSTEGRWTIQLLEQSSDCGMSHCVDVAVTRGPTLRAITVAGRPSVLVEVRQTATRTTTNPDTGKAGPALHESTALFLTCTRTTGNNPGWTCLRGSIDADRCTLTITRAGKIRTGCTADLTFDQPTD